MAVIPFVIDSSNPTVVSSRQEFEEAGGLDGQALFIQNLDHDQVGTARSDGNVSYDFRVGDEYRDHRDVGKTELLEDDEITLLSGAAVIIETMEKEAKRIVGAAKANAWFRLRDFVENNSGLLSAVATILSAVLIILEIIRLFVK